jgi:hypothetical protein
VNRGPRVGRGEQVGDLRLGHVERHAGQLTTVTC